MWTMVKTPLSVPHVSANPSSRESESVSEFDADESLSTLQHVIPNIPFEKWRHGPYGQYLTLHLLMNCWM